MEEQSLGLHSARGYHFYHPALIYPPGESAKHGKLLQRHLRLDGSDPMSGRIPDRHEASLAKHQDARAHRLHREISLVPRPAQSGLPGLGWAQREGLSHEAAVGHVASVSAILNMGIEEGCGALDRRAVVSIRPELRGCAPDQWMQLVG
jgi:hypothetical protein